MRYSFQCLECELVQEWIGSYADKPEDMPCNCGGIATQLLGDFSVVVKHAERTLRPQEVRDAALTKAASWVGKHGDQQVAKDRKAVSEMRKIAEESKRSGSKKGDMRLVASIPTRYMKEHSLDKGNGWLTADKDRTKKQLKQDGLWFGD